jgi:hypothetical protein
MSLNKAKIALTLLLAVARIVSAAGLAAHSAPLQRPLVMERSRTAGTEWRCQGDQDPVAALAGPWLMTLPAGLQYPVALRPLGENRLAVENAVRFSGIYEFRDGRLVLVEPIHRTEPGYEWAVQARGQLVLVAQVPVRLTGQNYLGAMLTRPAAGQELLAQKPHEDAGVRWDPARVEGGFMFRDAAAFRSYVRTADVIAVGTLKDWDGARGTVAVEKRYRGKAKDGPLAFTANGGIVAAKAGQKVLVLLQTRKDATQLHSYCAAPGLFRYSEELLALVQAALKVKPPRGAASPDQMGAVRALEQIPGGAS